MRRTSYLAGVIAVTLTLGCNDHFPSDNPSAPAGLGRGQAAIIDGNSGGNGYFRFLPPTVTSGSALPGQGDKNLYPVLEICRLVSDECESVVWTFTRANKQANNRKLHVSNNYYADWATAHSNLNPGANYRASVTIDDEVVGYADIDVVSTAAELNSVDHSRFVGVVNGAELRIAFWIQSGTFAWITTKSGGGLVADGGILKLNVPKGALEDRHIGPVRRVPPPAGATLVANTYYEFSPDDVTFAKPAELMIGFDPKWVPASIRSKPLKLLRYSHGAWSEVANATVVPQRYGRGEITVLGGYALGVLESDNRIVDVAVNTQPVLLGAQLNAVQRIRDAVAQTSCSNNLRQIGLLANNLWTRAASIPIVSGECPFSAYIARAGVGYQIEGIVDGITGTSSVFDVTLPSGAQLRFQNVPGGPFFADGNVPTNGITILAQDGQGNAMRFVDVDITVSGGGSLNFGGAPQTLYPARTDASGIIAFPAGNWRLAPTPQTNTLAAVLPGTSVAVAHDIITTSGAPQALIAVPMPASIQVNTPTSIEVTARDAQGNLVSINQPFSAVANGPNGESQLGSVDAVNGRATFNVSFAQPGYNNTITFSAAGLTSHTTNAFTIWQLPVPPTALQVSSPTQTGFDLGYQVAPVFGSNPRRLVSWQSVNQPNGSVETALAPMFGGGQIVDQLGSLLPNTRYSVRSRVCIDEGCSADSQPAEAFTLPGAMVNLRARTIEQNRIVMESDAATGGADVTNTYRFYVSSNGGPEQQACSSASPVCDLTSLAAATAYSISGEVCNSGGCGPRSAPVQVTTLTPPPPSAPDAVSVVTYGTTSMNLGITNVPFAGSNPRFEIRFAPSPGGTAQMLTVPMNDASAQPFPALLSGLTAGTLYDLSARACDSNGCSAFSLSTVVPTLQPAPQNMAVSNLTTSSAVVTWADQTVPNGVAHSFQVHLQQGSGPLQLVTTVTAPTVNLSGLLANTSYTAQVRACNVSGCSPAQVSFTTPAPPPPPGAPNRLQINSQAFNSIVLAWSDNSSNEDGFRVMRRTLPSTTFVQIGATAPNVATFNDTDLIQGLTVVYRVDAFNAGGSSSSNETSTIVPTGQTQPMATYGTLLTQTGTAGVAAPSPARVRLITATGTPAFNIPVTFTITSPTSSFVTLVPRTTVVVVNTTSTGIATAPAWILESGTSTVVASAPGYNQVTFTAIAN